jgi:hypothetical protein
VSRFLTPLRLEAVDDGSADERGTWMLLTDFLYESDLLGHVVIARAGDTTDLASVPRIPVAYLLTGGAGRKAAVIHDTLYKDHEVNGEPVSRAQADAVFREALAAQGEPGWRAWTMWAGVRVGGGQAWDDPHQPYGTDPFEAP